MEHVGFEAYQERIDQLPEADYFKVFDLEVLDYSKIVKTIKEIEDISTYKLADRMGTSQSTITRIERGKQQPKGEMKKRLFNLFSYTAMAKLSEGNVVDEVFNVDVLSKNPTLMQAIANIHLLIDDMMKTNPDRVKHLAVIGYWTSIMLSYIEVSKELDEEE